MLPICELARALTEKPGSQVQGEQERLFREAQPLSSARFLAGASCWRENDSARKHLIEVSCGCNMFNDLQHTDQEY